MSGDKKGKAKRGSQLWLQKFVNEQPKALNKAIIDVAPALAGQTIEWVSPLASQHYAEYKDQLSPGDIIIFKYPGDADAVYVANHNAYAPQEMTLKLDARTCAKATVELLDRKTEKWRTLEARNGSVSFKLPTAGGELLRIKGRSK